jgi:hypothetical protein
MSSRSPGKCAAQWMRQAITVCDVNKMKRSKPSLINAARGTEIEKPDDDANNAGIRSLLLLLKDLTRPNFKS